MKKFRFISFLFIMIMSLGILCSCSGEQNNELIESGDVNEKLLHTVIFDSNGGSSVESVQIESGKKLDKPSEPVRKGYTFEGWYFRDEQWSFIGFAVTEDITLKAKWSINSYKVTFVLDESNIKTETYEYNSKIDYELKRKYYKFLGWSLSKSNDEILTDYRVPDKDITIYAKWEYTGLEIENGQIVSVDKNITAVSIPDSVTSIGNAEFYGCSFLSSITIPDSVTSIGSAAFNGCSSLESITLPFVGNTATSTGLFALFGYIFGEDSYTGGIATKQSYQLESYLYYKTYYIPSSLKEVIITGGSSIERGAFYNCSSLTSIVIPNGVTSIAKYTFQDCSSLTSIEIPESVREIGIRAFEDCSSLTSIKIPNSVTSIGNGAFSGCSSLESITIPNSVTSIGNSAFWNCSSLESITIPNSVTSIGNSAFWNCSSLTSVTLPFVGGSLNGTSNTHFGYIFGASSYSDNDDDVPKTLKEVIITGGTTIGNNVFRDCDSLKSIVIPDSVTEIGEMAFYRCSSLKSIVIPNSVREIGEAVFSYCSSLKSIVIPDGVTLIGSGTFRDCDSLKSIVIPDSVTEIGAAAFEDCNNLTNIVIPDGVWEIGVGAFEDCNNLTNIVIPESVRKIGIRAFYNCSSLTSIVIPRVTWIRNYAFQYCSSLTIYCKDSEEPSDWDSYWNYSKRPVYWAGEWEYDANGNPVPLS